MSAKNYLILLSLISPFATPTKSQAIDQSYKIETINKKIKDFDEKESDLSTPLKASVKYSYAFAKGQNSQIFDMSSPRIRDYKPRTDKIKENDYSESSILNSTILEVINYKDSIAAVIRKEDDMLISHILTRQNGRWLDDGEDLAGPDIQSAEAKFKRSIPFYQNALQKTAILDKVSTDTLAFVKYLERHGMAPQNYLLKKLATHKLVVYGEIHGRKISWDFMRSVIKSPGFAKHTGTIFMELAVNSQEAFDYFLNNKTKDPEAVLDIFRKEQLMGWNDKGMYEFILDIWDINNKLPKDKKIRIVPVDPPRPFYNPEVTREDYNNYNRNVLDYRDYDMANNIERHIENAEDKRNCLYIVGYMHSYRSEAFGIGSRNVPDKRNCISILSDRLTPNSIFSIIAPTLIVTNSGVVSGLTRKGIFDYAFAEEGNKPIAFDLKDSPFGKEPLDVIDNRYDIKIGTYADCFDGYIFLQPLKDEESRYWLPELMTKDFFEEIKRRAAIVGTERYIMYPGVKIKDAEYEDYLLYMKNNNKDRSKRWVLP